MDKTAQIATIETAHTEFKRLRGLGFAAVPIDTIQQRFTQQIDRMLRADPHVLYSSSLVFPFESIALPQADAVTAPPTFNYRRTLLMATCRHLNEAQPLIVEAIYQGGGEPEELRSANRHETGVKVKRALQPLYETHASEKLMLRQADLKTFLDKDVWIDEGYTPRGLGGWQFYRTESLWPKLTVN